MERASESVRPRRCVVTVTAQPIRRRPRLVRHRLWGRMRRHRSRSQTRPRKCDPVAATAISATVEPKTNGELHRSPQSIPAGALVTVPRPVPVLVTTIGKLSSSKTAVTVAAAVSETVQLPLPVQAPVQALNLEPAAGCGLSVTLVFQSKAALQVVPQSIPAWSALDGTSTGAGDADRERVAELAERHVEVGATARPLSPTRLAVPAREEIALRVGPAVECRAGVGRRLEDQPAPTVVVDAAARQHRRLGTARLQAARPERDRSRRRSRRRACESRPQARSGPAGAPL